MTLYSLLDLTLKYFSIIQVAEKENLTVRDDTRYAVFVVDNPAVFQ